MVKRSEVPEREQTVLFCGPSMTKQSDAESCDINLIVDRFQRGGALPVGQSRAPMYGDFASLGDYQSSLNVVLKAEAEFAGLPAVVRDRFRNDPRFLLEFIGDPKNTDECVKMGLFKAPEPVKGPQDVRITNPEAFGGPGKVSEPK